MRVIFFGLIVMISCMNQLSAQVNTGEISLEKRLHYKVKVAKSEWYIDKYSGGISAIIDKDGTDWINWKRLEEEKYPESAAADYRGMPNLVFGGNDGGVGHPGFDKSLSFQDGDKIKVRSLNSKWEFQYIFHPKYVELEILQNPSAERNYWFLYEGIPGGEFNPELQYWGTNEGLKTAKPDYFAGEEEYGSWRWVFFGHENADRVLYIVQKEEDNLSDTFGFLGNSVKGLNSADGMVVFGFGREKNATALLNRKNTFYIGFFEQKIDGETFPKLEKFIQKTFY